MPSLRLAADPLGVVVAAPGLAAPGVAVPGVVVRLRPPLLGGVAGTNATMLSGRTVIGIIDACAFSNCVINALIAVSARLKYDMSNVATGRLFDMIFTLRKETELFPALTQIVSTTLRIRK